MKNVLIALILTATFGAAHAVAAKMADEDNLSIPTSPGAISQTADTNPDMLSDDFMRDVSDGAKPSEDGKLEEEESGEIIDQTLRAHTTRPPN